MKKLIILISLLFTSQLWAQNFTKCVDSETFNKRFSNSYFTLYKVNGECWLSVHPDNQWPIYRDYMFGDQSWLMIFASLGAGSPSTDTGAREFSFFPRTEELAFSLDEQAEMVIIKVPNGATFTFDLAAEKIIATTGIDYEDEGTPTRTNGGGLELTPTQGLILDEGWTIGELPRIHMNNKSTFKDALGNSCQQKNSNLFKLIYDQRGGVDGAVLKFVTDQDLKTFIEKSCPQIDTGDL